MPVHPAELPQRCSRPSSPASSHPSVSVATGNPTSTRETNFEFFVKDKNVLVVMPYFGPTGIPARWYDNGKGSRGYETIRDSELMQLLERGYRAIPVRAVAGVSPPAATEPSRWQLTIQAHSRCRSSAFSICG